MNCHSIYFLFFVLVFIFNTTATEFWTKAQFIQFESEKSQMRIKSISASFFRSLQTQPMQLEKTHFPYIAEFLQIAQFMAQWQVTDTSSADFGGMIEAESGDLGDVIQTDNTQEAIVVWCQYAKLTGDTSTYRNNIADAWTYIMNFPAYDEEGDPGDHYYRDHNCAWALWGNYWYETIYSDTSYRWYSDSCATFMANHQLDVFDPTSSRNAFVMGWMAGNLYDYSKWRSNSTWTNAAVVMGNKVINWLNADPVNNFNDYTWAMSSGTCVHGVINSVFQEDSLAGITWIQNNAQYLPVYFDNINPGSYVWDSSWNVALANAYRAMYTHTQDNQYNTYHQMLTDTLLALDVDNDGGITANKNHPPNEDMTWVSAYLDVMGVDFRIDPSITIDAGVINIYEPNDTWTYIIGDTIGISATVANFGFQDLPNVTVTLYANSILATDTIINLNFSEIKTIEIPHIYIIQNSGSLEIKAEVIAAGDQNSINNIIIKTIDIPPFITVTGMIKDSDALTGIGAQIQFNHFQRTFRGSAVSQTGTFQIDVIPGDYSINIDTEYPYQQFDIDSFVVGQTPPPACEWFTKRGDVVFIDDDEGSSYEDYYLYSFNKILERNPNVPWQAYHHWNTQKNGVFPASRYTELKRPWIVWFTGDADTTALTQQELDSLQYLLDHNTCILLTGKDIAESLQGTTFLSQSLYSDYVSNSITSPKRALGVAGNPITNGIQIFLQGDPGANNQLNDRDIINPLGIANTIFYYKPGLLEPAGHAVENGYKLIFLGFGVEAIRDEVTGYANRDEFLENVFNWFEGISRLGEENLPIVYKFELLPAYPNPFNNEVQISFTLDKPRDIGLYIYNVLGQKIKSLAHQNIDSGFHKIYWNGQSENGRYVSSGIYYVVLQGSERNIVQKILLIK